MIFKILSTLLAKWELIITTFKDFKKIDSFIQQKKGRMGACAMMVD